MLFVKRMQTDKKEKKIIFIETLNGIDFFKAYKADLILFNNCGFLQSKLLAILKRIKCLNINLQKIQRLEWGDTKKLNNSLKNASINSRNYMEDILTNKINYFELANKESNLNFCLIYKKFIFSEVLFKKYFFYEIIQIYCQENPNYKYVLYLNSLHLGVYKDKLSHLKLILTRKTILNLVINNFILKILIINYWRLKATREGKIYENKILCYVETTTELNAYKQVLSKHNPIFITKKNGINIFKDSLTNCNVIENDINYICITYNNWRKVKKIISRILKVNFNEGLELILNLGDHFPEFINKLFYAIEQAPEGSGNSFVVFEHHDFLKTVRNEFLRESGNYSIFFPVLSGYSLRYYPPEYYQNYDHLISSGKALESSFSENFSSTKSISKIGSFGGKSYYQINENSIVGEQELLAHNLQGNKVVTFLTPGVFKSTYESELQLLSLARQISLIPNTKVIIRPKIVDNSEYWEFYKNQVSGFQNIILTGAEYALLDLVKFTDLFITSYSTSACDVALRGAPIYFVDYLNQGDRFIFFDERKIYRELQLDANNAFSIISRWLRSPSNEGLRKNHSILMNKFIDHIEYKKLDFNEYKRALEELFQIQPWK